MEAPNVTPAAQLVALQGGVAARGGRCRRRWRRRRRSGCSAGGGTGSRRAGIGPDVHLGGGSQLAALGVHHGQAQRIQAVGQARGVPHGQGASINPREALTDEAPGGGSRTDAYLHAEELEGLRGGTPLYGYDAVNGGSC